MANTLATAQRWVRELSVRSELPFGEQLGRQFAAARITRFCDCGCNSFECTVPGGTEMPPLFEERGLRSFEAVFEAAAGEDPIDVVFHADDRGLLAGIDIHLGLSNHAPVPENAALGKLLFTEPAL